MHSMIYKYPNPMKRLSNDTNIYFLILHFHTWTDVWEEISNFMQSKETTWQLIGDIHDKMIILTFLRIQNEFIFLSFLVEAHTKG